MTAAANALPSLRTAMEALRHAIWRARRVGRSLAPADGLVIRHVSVPAPVDCTPLDWLASGVPADLAPSYWCARDGQDEMAGLDIAWAAEVGQGGDWTDGLFHLQAFLDHAPAGLRLYGGAAFAGAAPGERLPAARFVLPRLTWTRSTDTPGRLTAYLLYEPGDDWEASLDEAAGCVEDWLDAPALPSPPLPPLRTQHEPLTRAAWAGAMDHALAEIAAGRLEKVVLARQLVCTCTAPMPPVALLRALAARNPGTFHYLVSPADGQYFLGASPERLLRRTGRQVLTEAVAGTRLRGANAAADDALSDGLLHTDKDRREHRIVMDSITQALTPLCTAFAPAPGVTVLRLPHLQHLLQAAHGTLRPGVHTAALLAALHPTPAVGGWPAAAALAAIRQLEPFARGWYAGPVGWVSRTSADFAVGLRSALVARDQVTLCAGAGIVAGSDAELEWQEINAKLASLLAILAPHSAVST